MSFATDARIEYLAERREERERAAAQARAYERARKDREAPLAVAIREGNVKRFEKILRAIPKKSKEEKLQLLFAVDGDGDYALHRALSSKDPYFIKRLKQYYPINFNGFCKKATTPLTPLMIAINLSNESMIRFLLEEECVAINTKDELGRCALAYAIHVGNQVVINLLLNLIGQRALFDVNGLEFHLAKEHFARNVYKMAGIDEMIEIPKLSCMESLIQVLRNCFVGGLEKANEEVPNFLKVNLIDKFSFDMMNLFTPVKEIGNIIAGYALSKPQEKKATRSKIKQEAPAELELSKPLIFSGGTAPKADQQNNTQFSKAHSQQDSGYRIASVF